MADPQLLVPFGENKVFSLYRVIFADDYSELTWSILTTSGQSPMIGNKVENLQNYFTHRHNKHIGGNFQGINITDNSCFEKLTDTTPSVFLGLFLAAARKIQQRKLLSCWDTVTVTGDLEYEHNTGKMKLKDVGDIYVKYQAAKTYAHEQDGNHLFIYIGFDEKVPEGTDGNIEVKRFTEENSIFDVMASVFELHIPGMEIPDLDDTQKRLLNNVNEGQRCSYITTAKYEQYIQEAFSRDWTGFFIYGEGTSGKSVLAEALIRDMMRTGRIYAPVWISIIESKDEIEKEDIIDLIYSQFRLNPEDENALERVFSERQYLIAFDNLNMDNAALNKLLKEIGGFIKSFCKNKPFLIITSRNYSDKLVLPNNITPITPSALQPEHIEFIVPNLAKQGGYLEKIESIEDTEEYGEFLSLIAERLGSTPGLISPVAGLLRKNSIKEAVRLLKNIKDRGLQEKVTEIYKISFQYLSKKTKVVLFIILNSTEPDVPASREEILNHQLTKHFITENEIADEEDIEESLGTLLDYNFIYSTEESGETKYAVKTHCFVVFTFADEFAGDNDNKTLREEIMLNLSWKLYIALFFDRGKKIIEPILGGLKKNKIKPTQFHLFTAAEYSSSTEVLKLLKYHLKGKIDVKDEYGETAFLRAASSNPHPEIISWFLENLRKKAIFRKDGYGLNAFCNAALFNTKPEILKLLAEKGRFNPNDRIKNGLAAGHTPFLLSLEKNTGLDICACFIDDLGCDVNNLYFIDTRKIINDLSIEENLDTENMGHVNLINFRKYARNNQEELKDELKWSVFLPVIRTLQNPNIKVLEKVLSSGADIKMVTEYVGIPLLHLAAKIVSRPEYLEIIKKTGCKIQERDQYTFTALHHAACFNGSKPVFNWLIENGIEIDAAIDGGVTGLHLAAQNNPHPDIIEWFAERVKDINVQDDDGLTPLHYAVVNNTNPEIYQWLVKHGVKIDVQDNDGLTPLQHARQNKTDDRVEWLIQYETNAGL